MDLQVREEARNLEASLVDAYINRLRLTDHEQQSEHGWLVRIKEEKESETNHNKPYIKLTFITYGGAIFSIDYWTKHTWFKERLFRIRSASELSQDTWFWLKPVKKTSRKGRTFYDYQPRKVDA